ncbi:SDR family NAD(P)-dependent oxidoreductase [Streptomyces kebangsaanensis]|uniref:SDR family NAD(P)-dependent oxidoreductase n=1 Tax=Streptomyces kebangsaanensis TaxID=864058 RepID=UPI00093925D1|nr:SDR family NAD(P)-dependent oxidoreductase [Streptomyces kebangsaanensis]
MTRLSGKTAVVTGGTRGLGSRIAQLFLREGADVVVASRDRGDWCPGPGVDGARVAFHPVDVRDPVSTRDLMSAAADRFGTVDIVVANAGVSRPGAVEKIAPAHWAEVVDTNVTGVFNCAQAAIPHLRLSRAGRLITVSSVLGSRFAPGAAAYGASKAAVEAFTKVVAVELAADGITANCLSPGFIDEGMGVQLRQNEAIWEKYRTKLASGRMGRGDEVASAAVFLAGDDSSYVNGHVLEVNGGLFW